MIELDAVIILPGPDRKLKTKTYPWWQNTEIIEFRSQCYILLLIKNFYFFNIALNRVLTLADYRSRQAELKSSGIIDFENKNISVVTKHWKYRISVPMLYIAFVKLIN